jgi:hypothetical protein
MRRPFDWLILPLLLVLAGCGTPGDQMRPVPIAGGRVVDIPFGPGGPRAGRANGYEVKQANLAPGAQEREVIYQFAFTSLPGAELKSVQVEDISDDKAYPLIDDQHPWLTDNRWHAETRPIAATDPRLAWVYQVVPSMRVYRFTLIDTADRRSVLYQLAVYPDFIKSAIRRKWGEKY